MWRAARFDSCAFCLVKIDKHYEKFHAYLQYTSHGLVYQYIFLILL